MKNFIILSLFILSHNLLANECEVYKSKMVCVGDKVIAATNLRPYTVAGIKADKMMVLENEKNYTSKLEEHIRDLYLTDLKEYKGFKIGDKVMSLKNFKKYTITGFNPESNEFPISMKTKLGKRRRIIDSEIFYYNRCFGGICVDDKVTIIDGKTTFRDGNRILLNPTNKPKRYKVLGIHPSRKNNVYFRDNGNITFLPRKKLYIIEPTHRQISHKRNE